MSPQRSARSTATSSGSTNQHINGGGRSLSRAVAKTLTGKMQRLDSETETFVPSGGSFDSVPAIAPALTSNYGKQPDNSDTSAGPMLAVDLQQVTSKANRSRPTPVSPPLTTDGTIIAIQDEATRGNPQSGPGGKGWRNDGASFTHQADHVQAVAYDDRNQAASSSVHHTLRSDALGSRVSDAIVSAMAVRRLTPRECERLQGFPDDYTLVPYRKKPAADGPRYKALGNSMAINMVRWIGQRIQAVENITNGKNARRSA